MATLLVVSCCAALAAAEPLRQTRDPRSTIAAELLTDEEWKNLDRATDRALEFLAKTQRADGSYEAPEMGQPALSRILCQRDFPWFAFSEASFAAFVPRT